MDQSLDLGLAIVLHEAPDDVGLPITVEIHCGEALAIVIREFGVRHRHAIIGPPTSDGPDSDRIRQIEHRGPAGQGRLEHAHPTNARG
jgi:hypothetical protein